VKTITENETKLSKYLFDDSKAVSMGSDKITIGDPSAPDFYIGDLTSSTATLTENVTDAPSDWSGNRYTYDPAADPKWVANPDWEDPEAE
tara:strand:- start:72 stop:341 length:270 start_codon:yes stop_codon:yes gene_type:complete